MRRFLLSPLLLLAVWPAGAQSTDAALTGSVTDPTGAAIPGAQVTAQNVQTGVVHRTVTNQAGVYLFAALPPGLYRVSAEATGFSKFTYSDVRLEVGARVNLDLPLQVGTLTSAVEVKAELETALGYASASVGGIVTGQKVLDLPLTARNALGLVYIHAGLVGDNFSGARIGTLNITVDGVNVQDNRINQGVSSPIFTSVDRIEEFRVITSPADAELGRGSGQIQMITRSGTNEFHGSLFEFHRNTVLTANTYFNNQRGRDPDTGEPISPRNFLIRNQYGGRIGGPIRKNQTFFHVLFEGQRIRTRNSVTNVTYTASARRGLFRFFPGVQNGNANARIPTVDLMGNPVRPPEATGDLQTVNLFGRDPNRWVPDPTGVIQRMLDLTPLPNNFRYGDGLNTAGYTWRRSSSDDADRFNIRLDHHFTPAHRATFSYVFEDEDGFNGFMPQPFPAAPGGGVKRRDHMYSLNLISTLRPSLLNEFRAGALRPKVRFYAPWERAGTDLQPKAGGQPYLLVFNQITDPLNQDNDPQGRITPVYQFGNNLSWLKGRHAFKGGAEVRFVSTNGFNSFNVMPRAILGTGGVPVQNLNTIPGIGQNLARAEAILNELTGTLARVDQAFNSPGGPDPQFLPGEPKQRTWKSREFSFFFKDDVKVTSNLTLHLGLRYERYGVPYEANGKAAALVGGSAAIFGISGSSFADLFQPGRTAGSLTRVQLVGPGSPNPHLQLYGDDNNNFAPAGGLSWSLPWFGKNKTVLRLGYGIGYERNALRLTDVVAGDQPGLRQNVSFRSGSLLTLSNLALPLKPSGKPLSLVPLTDRTQIVRTFDSGLRTPYVQNWNLSLQREIARGTTLDVRYVGNKGTKLIRGTNVNEANIFETGILEAFQITQAGGHAPLLDRIFRGLSVPGLGIVDGVRVTGSDAVRHISTTQSYLAQHNVGSFASYLNTSTQFTGEVGGLLRRAGLPENWIVANPQFDAARLTGNFANSTYHSLQVEVIRRFSAGWTFQGNYTWSKALGEEEGSGQEMIDSYRTLRNLRLDKRLLDFHVTHVFRNNGTFELPFGPNKRFLSQSRGLVARLLELWQVGFIFNVFSGSPLALTSGRASWNAYTDNPPTAVAAIDKSIGVVKRTGNGVVYFDELQQVPDPSIAWLTTVQGVRARSTLKAIADASGRILMVNPTPGTLGNIAPRFLEGPGSFRLDVNLIKRIRLGERKTLQLRADAIDATNKPQFGDPNVDINSPNFGRITSAGGNRIIVVGMRYEF